MAIIITNVTKKLDDDDAIDEYTVSVDISEFTTGTDAKSIVARFKHRRNEGTAQCLRLAADAVDEAFQQMMDDLPK